MKPFQLFFSFQLGLLLVVPGMGLQAQTDSLKGVLPTVSGGERVILLQEIAYQFLFSNLDSATAYARQSMEAAEQLQDDSLIAESWLVVGFAAFVKGDNDSAIVAYTTGADIHARRGDVEREAAILANVASVYHREGRLDKALEVSLKSLDGLRGGSQARLGLMLGNVGSLYQQLRMLETAKRYIAEALDVLEEAGDMRGFANAGNMMGTVLYEQDSTEEALRYYHRSNALYRQIDDPLNRASLYNNLGMAHQRLVQMDSAAWYFHQAFLLSEELQNPARQLLNTANLAETYLYDGDLASAAFWLTKGDSLRHLTTELSPLNTYFESLSLYQGMKGDYPAMFQSRELAQKYRDSILSEEKERSIAELEIRYETEKKDRMLAETALELEQQELRNQRMLFVGITTVLLLLLGGGLWMYRSRLAQREAIHQERIRQQEIRLETTIQTQEEERSRLARDLHDGIGQLLSAVRLNFGAFEGQIQEPSYDHSLRMLDEACREVREVAHMMMPRSLEQDGLAHALEEMMEKSLGNTSIQYHVECVGQIDRLNKKMEINIYRIAQELIQNILKHAKATEVSLQLIGRSDRLLLVVEDNGKGIDPGTQSSGLGMTNIQTRAMSIGAHFHIENGPESGTISTLRVGL